jgi:hypothetical protein
MKINFTILLLVVFAISTNAQLKIHAGGLVSIGTTTSPISSFRLQVVGNTIFSATSNSITSSAFIRGRNAYSTSSLPDYTWYNDDNTGIFHPSSSIIGFSCGGAERMRINSEGLVINTSGNWQRNIYVNATTSNTCGYHMTYAGQNTFFVHASGYIYSQGQYLGSDKNFKTNISTIKDPVNTISRLRGVTYHWNYPDSLSVFNTDELQMGLVAQEVESVLPYLVKTLPDGKKAVSYSSLIGLLIEGIKAQQIEIENLKEMVAAKSAIGITNENIGQKLIGTQGSNFLLQNTPNPFSKTTTIKYSVDESNRSASIYIFDLQGTLVKSYNNINKQLNSSVIIDAENLSPGMYIYTLVVNDMEVDSKRMILTH